MLALIQWHMGGTTALSHELLAEFERLIRRDPARRGLISSEPEYGPLCPGHLAEAAAHLAEHGRCVAIVTGFFIPAADPPAAETDGPPGALLLAAALAAAGIESFVLTDNACAAAVRATAQAMQFPFEHVLTVPNDESSWRREFFTRGPGAGLTHLIALERVGPTHTLETFSRQKRTTDPPLERFRQGVDPSTYDCCHNMRGVCIDEHTADLHRLFEELPRYRPDARTIGIGDGGNEIGMGTIPWEELARRLTGEHAGRIPCRIATDWTILAGTSNWGGYALAAATLLLRGRVDLLQPWDRAQQQRVLEHLVEHGPAVDGVTRLREPTVDGLPFLTYIQPWEGMRRLLGLEP